MKAKGELVAEPDTDAMKAVRRLLEKYNLIITTREEMEMISKEVVELMKKEGRGRLIVDGFTVTAKHIDARVKVQITKPRV